jgi:hypothetical protein
VRALFTNVHNLQKITLLLGHDLLWLSDHDVALVSGDQLVVRHVSFRQVNAPLTTADLRICAE